MNTVTNPETRVAVVGSGGREHAIVNAIAPDVTAIHGIGTNVGIALHPKAGNVNITSPRTLTSYVENQEIGLTIIGPEQPIADGWADVLRERGHLVLAPSQEAAQLETSKLWAIRFMERHGIDHPPLIDVLENPSQIYKLPEQMGKFVIKADWLASGKGVFLPGERSVAEENVHTLFARQPKGGHWPVILQERYHGPEVSAFAISDGRNVRFLPFAQDHKRLLDGDQGPNTGGMGAYTDVPEAILKPWQRDAIYEIMDRTIDGMHRDEHPFVGVLYGGFMLAEELQGQPAVIEYNVRFGDPEAQAILPMISDANIDVYHLFRQAAEGTLATSGPVIGKLTMDALTVCLADKNYTKPPEPVVASPTIHGLDSYYPGAQIYHGATKLDTSDDENPVVTAGQGRVLYVTGFGESLHAAADNAYGAIGEDGVHFDGMQYRSDIGHQALDS